MRIIDEVDQSKKGKIGYMDFLVATFDLKSVWSEKILIESFELFEPEEEGYITYRNFRKKISKNNIDLSIDDAGQVMRKYGLAFNARIEFNVFCKILGAEIEPLETVPDEGALER